MQGNVFDFFISYKQKDSSEFVNALADSMKKNGVEVWIDSDQMHIGDSILKSIDDGLKSSINAILVFSENYFEGWSEQERRAIFSMMVGGRIRIMPILFDVDHSFLESKSPMLSDIVSCRVLSEGGYQIDDICKRVLGSYTREEREGRLYELFFRCISKNMPYDPEIEMFLAVFENDTTKLEKVLPEVNNINITTSELWNRYNKSSVQYCFPEWRKLYLHLVKTGKIGHN